MGQIFTTTTSAKITTTSTFQRNLTDKYRDGCEEIFTFLNASNESNSSPDNFNVLVIGPTGTGKSDFINSLFNRKICESNASATFVTKDFLFINCKSLLKSIKKNTVLIDTIGLCGDAENKIINYYFLNNVKHLNKVIVLLPTRLTGAERKSLLQTLAWLDYSNHYDSFLFLINRTGLLSEIEKQNMIESMAKELSVEWKNLICVDSRHDFKTISELQSITKSFLENETRPISFE